MASGRVDFIAKQFDTLIAEKGYDLEHYKAMRCPCMNPETGHPDPNCSFCDKGWQYYGHEQIRGVITGITNEKQFVETGGMMLGTMQLTVPATVEMNYHDRIVHRKSIMLISELVQKTAGDTDAVRYELAEVSRLIDISAEYVEGVDFTVDGKRIDWIEDRPRPAEGVMVSVAYKTHPAWLVLSHLHLVRDTNVKFRQPTEIHTRLPIQALCKLEWLYSE